MKFTRFLNNSKGETLLSVVIAGIIIVVAFLVAGPTILNAVKSQKSSLAAPKFCNDIAKNIVAQIRSNGAQTKVHRAPVRRGSVRFNNRNWRSNSSQFNNINPGGIVNEHGLSTALESARWPALAVMRWNGGLSRFEPHAPRLMYSSVNFLQALNNSFTNQSCTNAQGIPINAAFGLENLLPQTTLDIYNEAGYSVTASIKTEPFRLSDETLLPCNGNLALRPFGMVEPPATDTLNITDNLAGRYTPNLGIKTEVFVSVDAADPSQRGGQTQAQCSVTEKFQYNRVISRIPAPDVSMSGNLQVSLRSIDSNGDGDFNDATDFQFNPGTFMACAYQWSTFNFTNFNRTGGGGDLNQWIPCEQVRVCNSGRPPRISEGPDHIEFNFQSGPANTCLLTVRAIAFDAIGNVSTATAHGCLNGGCQGGTGLPPIGGGGGGGGGGTTGYQVSGVTFSDRAAAVDAAAITGDPIQTIDISATATATINSSNMRSHANAMTNISTATAGVHTSIGGLGRADVSGAQGALSSAQSNVTSAQSALADAQNMPSSMGAVKSAAVEQAEEELAAAEEAERLAQEALDKAEDEKDEDDAAAAGP